MEGIKSFISWFQSLHDSVKNEKGIEIKNYLTSINPNKWTRVFFQVPRFVHITCNVADPWMHG